MMLQFVDGGGLSTILYVIYYYVYFLKKNHLNIGIIFRILKFYFIFTCQVNPSTYGLSLVVSPLRALIEDQVTSLNRLGLSVTSITLDSNDEDVQGILKYRGHLLHNLW